MNNDKGNGIGTALGFFTYFWMFEIAAFIVFKFMGFINNDTSWKVILVLFLIIGLAYTGFYLIKKSGDRKRAARKEAAAASQNNYQKKKKKR